ncbi:hypothetical protein OnM2_022059 [Erysiphe neolycopersici]|uniref:Reverse transcriptase Ty1/copia-type domain-containing protein n=1 Tax=Erysiphe neolycopersici TaxID=212602 RepID=A0A420I2R8_9PEZI|nr:hypothetical protein OnM2_022059 [Erysiphe neolycopersici]
MVIRGDLQVLSERDTYAATLAIRIYRAVLSFVAYFDLEANQFDVTKAFPHADLDEDDEVNIHYPNGFKVPGSMLRVMKALYGRTVSPRLWYNHLIKTLTSLGLRQVPESGCVFCSSKIIVCFYVDDIAAFYHMRNKDAFDDFKKLLFDTYNQRCLRKVACSTPMSTEEVNFWEGSATNYQIHEYQRRIGSLTSPEESQSSTLRGCKPCYRLRIYLALENGINFQEGPVFVAASDASFGDNHPGRNSSETRLFILFGGVIEYHAKKKKTAHSQYLKYRSGTLGIVSLVRMAEIFGIDFF